MNPARRYALVVLCALSACNSLREVEMVVPANLSAAADARVIEGIGGWTRGEFSFAGEAVNYRRSESRLALFDVFERRAGYTRFTVAGTLFDPAVNVRCEMREITLSFGNTAFAPKPMAYGCDVFVDGRLNSARFELQESQANLGDAFMRYARRGEVAVNGATLTIASSHDLAGSRIQTATPIGYIIHREEVPIAALELNGTPRLFWQGEGSSDEQQAVLLAVFALALFWDPAASALGELD